MQKDMSDLIAPVKFKQFGGGNSKSKKKCPSTTRDKIRKRWWGANNYRGECFCCGEKLNWSPAVHVGRIQAGTYGGAYTPENSRLVCAQCNLGMGKTNMKVYMRRNYPERYKKYFPKSIKDNKTKAKRKRRSSSNVSPFGFSMQQSKFRI